jgi:hypothetical protein
MLQLVFHANLGGSIPSKMQAVISKKQAGFIETLANYFKANPE